MRHKHLESALSTIQREFPNPDITLEQYPTSPNLAASVALIAREQGNVGPGCTVADIGCGTGMLGLAAALLESDLIIAIDCDAEALDIARENAKILELEDEKIDFVLAKVNPTNKTEATIGQSGPRGRGKGLRNNNRRGGPTGKPHSLAPKINDSQSVSSPRDDPNAFDGLNLRSKCVDTVICNPPFGTKNNAGMDVQFLRTAVRLARRAVYSFHKTTTRAFLERLVTTEWKLEFTVVAEMQFDIDRMYKFHKDKTRDVAVDLIRIDISAAEDVSSTSHEVAPDNDNYM
jgi:predicted RNA methylase